MRYIYIYIYIYVCVCVCVCVCLCVCMCYVCIYVCVCYIYMCVNVRVYVNVNKQNFNRNPSLFSKFSKIVLGNPTYQIILQLFNSLEMARFFQNFLLSSSVTLLSAGIGGARGVVAIVVGNGHSDTSSNPGRD